MLAHFDISDVPTAVVVAIMLLAGAVMAGFARYNNKS